MKAVGRVSSSFSVSKRITCVKGKNKWWFVVKAPERSLHTLDTKWDHEFWQCQRWFRSSERGVCVGQAQVSNEDDVEGEGVMEGGEAGSRQLSMMCWSLCGWLRNNRAQHKQLNDEYDMRSAVFWGLGIGNLI